FPILWTEWNGLYRDVIRDFWRGQARVGDFAFRFTGSADLYERDGRRPSASINFVTAHDGFTLADLVSYNQKHNEANLEGNRDGTDDNRSWNCGVEGPTDDPQVNALRRRQQRNFLATLFLSQGVPMLLRGDAHTIGIFLNGREIHNRTPDGEPIVGDSFLLLFNAHYEPIVFTLPANRFGRRWTAELSTEEPDAEPRLYPARGLVPVEAR